MGLAPAASAPQPLDLRGAVAYALAHNANLASRRATLASDEATFAKDHSQEYPPVTGLLQNQLAKNNAYVEGSLAQYGIAPTEVFSQNLAQLGSTWTVYNGSNYQITAQRAKRQVQADRSDLKRAETQLTQNVSDDYFAVSVRRETVKLDEADEAYQQQLLAVSRDNEKVGRAAGVDVLRSQVNALRAQATLTTARSDELTAEETLATTMGAPPELPIAYADQIPEPPVVQRDPAELIAFAQARRGDVASAQSNVQAAKLADALIDTDRYPTLQISGAFGNQFSPTTTNIVSVEGATGVGQNLVLTRGNPGFWQIGATETFQFGFIDEGARHAQHRAAHIGIDAANVALETARDAVEIDVRQSMRGQETALANLSTAKEAAALGTESARISELQFKNGLISLSDATQAERDNLSAQNDLVNARVTYVNAIVQLRVAIGLDPPAIVDFRQP